MRSVSEEPEPFTLRLRRLRHARGLSLENLAFATRDHGPGITMSAVGQLERGVIHPRPETIEMLAHALGEDPNVFPEYRLAKAREELDERVVGLQAALEQLDQIVSALRQRAVSSGATATAKRARRRRGPGANPGEAASGEGA